MYAGAGSERRPMMMLTTNDVDRSRPRTTRRWWPVLLLEAGIGAVPACAAKAAADRKWRTSWASLKILAAVSRPTPGIASR
jgi:hypothetical protein